MDLIVIDREAALGCFHDWIDKLGDVHTPDEMVEYRAIEALPSAQPEIIRCKDCRFYQDNNGGYPHMNCKWDANETPDEDDFCSGAERRTDD